MKRIVVHDPGSHFALGELIEGDRAVALLKSRGGVALPVEPDLIGRNAVSGFFRRDWGRGEEFNGLLGTRACPMLLYALPEYTTINWALRLLPIEGATECRGLFRLAAHSGQVGCITGGLAANGQAFQIEDAPGAPPAHERLRDGFIIEGTSTLNCGLEGYLGLSIYGTAIGLRVIWSAVTQTR